jgi:hypothetical protein
MSIVVSNSLQEVNNMNSHFLEHFVSEETKDTIHSIELFIAIAFLLSVVGLMFLAVA